MTTSRVNDAPEYVIVMRVKRTLLECELLMQQVQCEHVACHDSSHGKHLNKTDDVIKLHSGYSPFNTYGDTHAQQMLC